jgi:hypothetical protein
MTKIILMAMLIVISASNAMAYKYTEHLHGEINNIEIDFPAGWEVKQEGKYACWSIYAEHNSGNATVRIIIGTHLYDELKNLFYKDEELVEYVNDNMLYPLTPFLECGKSSIVGKPHIDIINGKKAVVSDFVCGRETMTYIIVFGKRKAYLIEGHSWMNDNSISNEIMKSLHTFKIIDKLR